MLNDAQIRKFAPKEKNYKTRDSEKLWLLVSPAGGKLWRYRYTFEGKEKQVAIGKYPAIGIADARRKRDECEQILARGLDPSSVKQDHKAYRVRTAHNTYTYFAELYLDQQKKVWSEGHHLRMTSHLTLNVLPWIGSKRIDEIRPIDIIETVKRVKARGALETARRCKHLISQVFKFAVGEGVDLTDPTLSLPRNLAPKPKVTHLAAITEPSQIGELLRSFEAFNGTEIVRAALRLSPLVFVRPVELREMEWTEIDFEAKQWTIPAIKTKKDRDLIVPLSTQAIQIIQDLKPLTGKYPNVFCGARKRYLPMCNGAINAALRRLGWDTKNEITGHGFRAMARTVLAERLGYDYAVLELQIAHKVLDPLGRAYNRTAFIEKRTEMMQAWADYLDELKAKDDKTK